MFEQDLRESALQSSFPSTLKAAMGKKNYEMLI